MTQQLLVWEGETMFEDQEYPLCSQCHNFKLSEITETSALGHSGEESVPLGKRSH